MNGGLKCELTPMGTVIEAENPMEIYTLVNKAQGALPECNRILISVNIDYRKSRKSGMKEKVEAVMKHL